MSSRPSLFHAQGEDSEQFVACVRTCADVTFWKTGNKTDIIFTHAAFAIPTTEMHAPHVRVLPDVTREVALQTPGVALALYDWQTAGSGKGIFELPFPIGIETAIAFLGDFLGRAKISKSGDADGSYERGWEVMNGDACGMREAIVVVRPTWILYHK